MHTPGAVNFVEGRPQGRHGRGQEVPSIGGVVEGPELRRLHRRLPGRGVFHATVDMGGMGVLCNWDQLSRAVESIEWTQGEGR